jgi:hypothetical protein
MAPAQYMEMKMIYTLSAMDTGINDKAIARISNPLLFCDRITSQHQTPK